MPNDFEAEPQAAPKLPFGPLVPPKRIKDVEYDDGQRLRVNPLFVPLEQVPPQWILQGEPDAVWHYSTVLRDTAENPGVGEWRVMLGSEQVSSVIPQSQVDDLVSAVRAYREAHPEKNIAPLTEEDLRRSMDGIGHPSIAVDFDADGKTREGKAALSGEFHFDPASRSGTVNDRSGRYMSDKARPNPADRNPAEIAEWGAEVARVFSAHLGVPISFEQIKTLPKGPEEPKNPKAIDNPTAVHTAALQPAVDTAPRADVRSRPSAAGTVGPAGASRARRP
ncbi:hypothetical protein [Streptomyces ziwulingensis]|uniref:Uncharacterized protein n=1 Tax=Streptomyces ziwulingensis TaxID=1045501 RepID=A0ABP9AZU1_9ACTN